MNKTCVGVKATVDNGCINFIKPHSGFNNMHDIINPAGSQATTGANQNILATGRLIYYNVKDHRKTK